MLLMYVFVRQGCTKLLFIVNYLDVGALMREGNLYLNCTVFSYTISSLAPRNTNKQGIDENMGLDNAKSCVE